MRAGGGGGLGGLQESIGMGTVLLIRGEKGGCHKLALLERQTDVHHQSPMRGT